MEAILSLLKTVDWPNIIVLVLGVSFIWIRAERVMKAMKEVGELLIIIPDSLADQSLTPEEIKNIKTAANEAYTALKKIVG